ncbi:MAG: Uncharacterized protein G01um101425_576 [Candidatus Peregrinibacteria bacterium Gr01-1014_25]|nr:MAG: Uncharacterized protein G01um101425_576 [Candidatus Peregrinibacteria bacterium Gr01-1014_25]
MAEPPLLDGSSTTPRDVMRRLGLLSLPRLRVAALLVVSVLLLGFILFRLLPSADIRIWPRRDTVSQTTNIFLVQSGAQLDTMHVRTMPLVPITVTLRKAITYDQVSQEFLGTASKTRVTFVNAAAEAYAFRKGTRLVNQAGMIFTLDRGVTIEAQGEVTIGATAADKDLYGAIIGERGNVPADVRWDVLGITPEERALVYGVNKEPATGGTTSTRTILTPDDLQRAEEQLKKILLADAHRSAEEERLMRNEAQPEKALEILRPQHSDLSLAAFSDILLPAELVGTPVSSIPVEGTITFTAFAYDAAAILQLLSDELQSHVREGKELLADSLVLERLDIRVIGFADDDYHWIKITADLTGTDRFIIDPLSPAGALFAKRVRESVAGKSRDDALRIVKNMSEVEQVRVVFWPPWARTLPTIPAHISISPQ